MKTVFSKVVSFFKREWFLLIMIAAIALIIMLFDMI